MNIIDRIKSDPNITERFARIRALYSGKHDPNGKMCAMEAVAFVAGEPWSDHPECACPVLSTFMRAWNDALPDRDRTRLAGRTPAPDTAGLEPDPADFTSRACHALLILSTAAIALRKLVTEAAENSNDIDKAELLRSIDAHLSDVGSDISGALHQAAERTIEDRYDGCRSRGPMHRNRVRP
jgi:hypothetical protein